MGYFRAYRENKMRRSSMELVEKANSIIADFEAQGYPMTLRQLYYQLVKANIIPNVDKEYDKLGELITNARYYGLTNWNAIEDNTRTLYGPNFVANPSEKLEAAAAGYKHDLWEDQDYRIEVWVEKDALRNVIARGAGANRCNYLACKGYMSASEMWRAAMRFIGYERQQQHAIILHLGDHDPSGLHMTADIRDRLAEFCNGHRITAPTVERLALNIDQIRQYDLPPNPAKQTDSRFRMYMEETGLDESWELDALSPTQINEVIQAGVDQYIDREKYDDAKTEETRSRAVLRMLAESDVFSDVESYITENYSERLEAFEVEEVEDDE